MQALSENEIIMRLEPIQGLNRNHELRYFFWRLYNHPENNIFMFWSTRSKEDFDEVFENRIAKNSKEVFVYFENDIPVGTCRIIKGQGPYEHVAICGSTTIDPDKKRQGTGTRLKKAVQEYVSKHYPDVKRYELTYEADNQASRQLGGKLNYYEKCGYKTEGQFRDFWPREAVSYEKMGENSPYEDWLIKNKGDHRLEKHFWFTTEIYAAFFKHEGAGYEETTMPSKSFLNVFSPSQIETDSSYSFRFAQKEDIAALIMLYKNSGTPWNAMYTNLEELASLLEVAVNSEKIAIITDTLSGKVIASCQVDRHPYPSVEHTVVIENPVSEQNAEAAMALFSGIANYYLNKDPAVKRIELNNVLSIDASLIEGLESSHFEFCGLQRGRYFHKEKEKYLDELMFECNLFNLDDALRCCQKRLNAEKKLLAFGVEVPFNLKLEEAFLTGLIEILTEIKSRPDSEKISLEQGNIIYRLIRNVCTQDYLSVEQRLSYLTDLRENFNNFISKDEKIVVLFDVCQALLSQKFTHTFSTYPEYTRFFRHKKNIDSTDTSIREEKGTVSRKVL
jgi:RimJ/RimL family protein N-acetyltransferase